MTYEKFKIDPVYLSEMQTRCINQRSLNNLDFITILL